MKKTTFAAALLACSSAAFAQAFATGQWVLARANDGSTHYYPGVVVGASDASVTIQYDDGTRETRPANQVRPYDWRVGSRLTCLWAQDGKPYPAVITGMGADGGSLTVRYLDDNSSAQVATGQCYTS
jgi:hypothetical protein